MTLGWGHKVKYYLISSRAWGLAMEGHGIMEKSKVFQMKQAYL